MLGVVRIHRECGNNYHSRRDLLLVLLTYLSDYNVIDVGILNAVPPVCAGCEFLIYVEHTSDFFFGRVDLDYPPKTPHRLF